MSDDLSIYPLNIFATTRENIKIFKPNNTFFSSQCEMIKLIFCNDYLRMYQQLL